MAGRAGLLAVVIVIAFTAGSALIMWLGEQIDRKGIGNGISLLIFAGIVSRLGRMPAQIYTYVCGIIAGIQAGGALQPLNISGTTYYFTADGAQAYPWYYILYLLLIRC